MSGITEQSIRRHWDANPEKDFYGVEVGVLLCEIDRLRALNAELLAACECVPIIIPGESIESLELRYAQWWNTARHAAISKATGAQES